MGSGSFRGATTRVKDVHEPAWPLWSPPLLLALGGLLAGVVPSVLNRPIASAATAAAGMPVEVSLSSWHGITPALLLSVVLGMLWRESRSTEARVRAPRTTLGFSERSIATAAGLALIALLVHCGTLEWRGGGPDDWQLLENAAWRRMSDGLPDFDLAAAATGAAPAAAAPHRTLAYASRSIFMRELELRQARVRQVERNGDAGNAIWCEPLVRQPVMRAEGQPARCQFLVQLRNPRLEAAAFDADVELPHLQVEQLLVRHLGESLRAHRRMRLRAWLDGSVVGHCCPRILSRRIS